MSDLNAVAVFCGSNTGNQQAFTCAAQSVGHAISKAGKALVYGGGNKGVMGTVSSAVLETGGRVIGVIPYAMARNEDRYNGIHASVENIVVNTMHERKVEMAKRSEGFIALPGGLGTFEELFEMITWTQLDIHNKPVVIVNVHGYFNPLRELIRSGTSSGFIPPQNEGLVIFVDGPTDISAQESHNWGQDAIDALGTWKRPDWAGLGYDWTKKRDGGDEVKSPLDVS